MNKAPDGVTDVLYVSPFSHIGGGEVSILTLVNNLDRRKFLPHLVCYEDGPFVEMARSRGVDTVVMKRSGVISEISIVLGLAGYIKRKDVRLVHVNSLDIRAAAAAVIAGVPYIGHLRVIFPFTWRDRLFVRGSRLTIAVSNAAVDNFCQKVPRLREKFIVIPNMVDVPPDISPASLRSEFGIPSGAPLVGMVGRMDPFKGHNVFIDAAAIIKNDIPDAKFIIVGGPSKGDMGEEAYFNQQKIRAENTGMGDSVLFTGFRSDILNVIAALDVLVVPSRVIKNGAGVSTEGFGRVVIEAMAVGVPVVSSDSGGLKEIIRSGVSGIIVPGDDPGATAEAVTGILRNKEMAGIMIRSAKKQFDRMYSLKSMGRMQDLYFDIIKKTPSRILKDIILNAYFAVRLPILYAAKYIFAPKTGKPDNIARILVIRLDRLGDLVLSIPLLDSLRVAYPRAKIDLMVRPYLAELAGMIPAVNDVIVYADLGDTAKRLPNRSYDVAIDMLYDHKVVSALAALLSKAPVRIGFSSGGREILFTDPVGGKCPGKGMVELDLELLKPLGVAAKTTIPKIGAGRKPRASGTPLTIAIHPGGHYESQRWPAVRFASLGRSLAGKYRAKLVVMGTSADKPAVDIITSGIGLPGAIKIFPTMKGLVEALAGCDLLICNNSGPLHLAAALGVPTISTMGPTDPVLWWPKGENNVVVRKTGSYGCPEPLEAISAEEMFNKTTDLIRKIYGIG